MYCMCYRHLFVVPRFSVIETIDYSTIIHNYIVIYYCTILSHDDTSLLISLSCRLYNVLSNVYIICSSLL